MGARAARRAASLYLHVQRIVQAYVQMEWIVGRARWRVGFARMGNALDR